MVYLSKMCFSRKNILHSFVVVLLLSIIIVTANLCVAQTSQSIKIDNSQYFFTKKVALPDGNILQKVKISGPPKPPNGIRRTIVTLPKPDVSAGVNIISDVPAFTWSFGCSPTSASMIAAYYDRNGYPNIYTGPTNGGIMPLNNDDYWSTWVDSVGDTRNRCPLSATQKGLDGRTERGHVDDYWIGYGDEGPDPFIVNVWTEHKHGECTADFMGTNQSSSPMENSDGGTTFWYDVHGQKLTSDKLYSMGTSYSKSSGLCGMQEFYESRGYTVIEAYNQLIYPYESNTQGFTYEQYKSEIDAGRPVFISLKGHSIVGIGYDDSSHLVYVHDTWDHADHSMTWGGEYSGMQQQFVSIVILESSSTPIPPGQATLISPSGTITDDTPTYTWNAVSDATQYRLWVNDGTGGMAIDTVYSANDVGCVAGTGQCSITPSTSLAAGSGRWRIMASNTSGNGPWSNPLTFELETYSADVISLGPVNDAQCHTPASLSAQVQNTSNSQIPSNSVVWFFVASPGHKSMWVGNAPIVELDVGASKWYEYNWRIPSTANGQFVYWAQVWANHHPISKWSNGELFNISCGESLAVNTCETINIDKFIDGPPGTGITHFKAPVLP